MEEKGLTESGRIFESTNVQEIRLYIEYLEMIIIMMEKRKLPHHDLLREKEQLLEQLKKLEND